MSKNFNKPEYGEDEYRKWIHHKTFTAFIEDVGHSCNNPLVSKILENFYTHKEAEMVFNTTQAEFDFAQTIVTISFFVLDGERPNIQLSFDELSKIFSYTKKFATMKYVLLSADGE